MKAIDFRGVPAKNWRDPGIRIDIGWRLRLMGGADCWAAEVSRNRQTKSGNLGKPERLVTLIGEESPADLLREVATLLEQDYPIEVTEETP